MDDLYTVYATERKAGKTTLKFSEWKKEYMAKLEPVAKAFYESVDRGREKMLDVLNRKSCKGCRYAHSYPGKTMMVWKCTSVKEPFVITYCVDENKKYPQCPMVRLWNQMRKRALENLMNKEEDNGEVKEDTSPDSRPEG